MSRPNDTTKVRRMKEHAEKADEGSDNMAATHDACDFRPRHKPRHRQSLLFLDDLIFVCPSMKTS